MTTQKDKATEKEVAQKNAVVVKGARVIKIDGVDYLPASEINFTDEQLKSQGVKHLFVAKDVEFLDDSKRTREFIAAIKKTKGVTTEFEKALENKDGE